MASPQRLTAAVSTSNLDDARIGSAPAYGQGPVAGRLASSPRPPVLTRRGLSYVVDKTDCRVTLIPGERRQSVEDELESQGIPMVFTDTLFAERAGLVPKSWLFVIETSSGRACGAFAVQHWHLRSLPGHSIYRLHQLGESVPLGTEHAVVDTILQLARSQSRLLSIEAEVSDADPSKRLRLSEAFRQAGFERCETSRNYSRSLLIDVQKSDEDLLGSFRPKARRMLRRAERYPVTAVSIEDSRYAPALERLHAEAHRRTGDNPPRRDWARHLDAARHSGGRMKLIGAFVGDRRDPSSLVAFASIHRNGSHTLYDAAGSARLPDRRVPLMYPVVWEAILWSRSLGVRWFDFGGISDTSGPGEDDVTAGISAFKRGFGGVERELGETWHLVKAPVRRRLAHYVHRLSRHVLPDSLR